MAITPCLTGPAPHHPSSLAASTPPAALSLTLLRGPRLVALCNSAAWVGYKPLRRIMQWMIREPKLLLVGPLFRAGRETVTIARRSGLALEAPSDQSTTLEPYQHHKP